jgi:thiol-disulfide isomerase/thioredoxin
MVAGCDPPAGRPAEVDPARRAQGAARPATPPLKPGDPLPPLEAAGWLNGPPPAPGSPGVRLLVVDVWGIWCPNCALSAPGLERVYEKYSPQGVAFVSITNSEQAVVEGYVKRHAVPWPSGYGASSGTIAALGAASGMPGPVEYELAPTLYLVGPDGRVRWADGRGRFRHVEPQAWERDLDAAIAAALAAPEPKP